MRRQSRVSRGELLSVPQIPDCENRVPDCEMTFPDCENRVPDCEMTFLDCEKNRQSLRDSIPEEAERRSCSGWSEGQIFVANHENIFKTAAVTTTPNNKRGQL